MNRTLVNQTLAIAMIVIAGFAAVASAGEPISLDAFRDGINHFRNRQSGYALYSDEQVREIADNLLLYQRNNGGWPSNFDPRALISDADRAELERTKDDTRSTTLDNRATYPAVEYLAAAFAQTGDVRYRDASLRGLEFILAAQYENGGWPHSYPRKDGYRPHITIVDDVMIGVLGTLRRIDSGEPPFDFLDAKLREWVADAVRRGDRCLLDLQVRVDGQSTGWASQYDAVTLQPTTGRSFELPGLIGSESVGVLRYLMAIDEPSEEVRAAVRACIAWLRRSQIEGLRVERVAAERVRYTHHTADHDVVAVEDPQAPPIWARFYEIETNRPFMANRDGIKVFRLAEVDRERRTGYSWYTAAPRKFLDKEVPAWEKKWGQR